MILWYLNRNDALMILNQGFSMFLSFIAKCWMERPKETRDFGLKQSWTVWFDSPDLLGNFTSLTHFHAYPDSWQDTQFKNVIKMCPFNHAYFKQMLSDMLQSLVQRPVSCRWVRGQVSLNWQHVWLRKSNRSWFWQSHETCDWQSNQTLIHGWGMCRSSDGPQMLCSPTRNLHKKHSRITRLSFRNALLLSFVSF